MNNDTVSPKRNKRGRFIRSGQTEQAQIRKKAISLMSALSTKIKNGELSVETVGLWPGGSAGKWNFRIILVEAAVEVPSEQIQE